jgi:hypothetical protein
MRRSPSRFEENAMDRKDQYTPERIADRMQIQDLMYRWCRAVDRLDFDGIREIFHPDAIDSHGAYEGDIDGLIAWIKNRHKPIPFSVHQISNLLIEFATPDLALVETYIWSVQRYPPNAKASLAQLSGGKEGKPGVGIDMTGCSRYIDRFERRNGEWRISRRTVVFGIKMMHEIPGDAPEMRPEWINQRRDRDDWIFRERRALGLDRPEARPLKAHLA